MKHTPFEATFSWQSESGGCPYTIDKKMMPMLAV